MKLSSEVVPAAFIEAYGSFFPWLQRLCHDSPRVASTLAALGAALAFNKLYEQRLVEKYGIVELVPKLSEKRQGPKLSGTVVICGGSLSGLLAARVCSDHFEKVIVIEPEEWVHTDAGKTSEGPSPKRAHVFQYTFLHHYHHIVTLCLQQLFPEFPEEVVKLGSRLSNELPAFGIAGLDFLPPANYPFYAPYKVFPSNFALTRPRFEALVRSLVQKHCPNVEYIVGTATGLVPSDNYRLINAVSVRSRDGKTIDLPASLVIDCTGAAMSGYRWLKAIPHYNNSSPKLETLRDSYDHKMDYNTLEFDIPDDLINHVQERTGMPMPFVSNIRLCGYLPIPTVESKTFAMERREKNLFHVGLGTWGERDKINNASEALEFIEKLKPIRPLPQWMFKLIELMATENVPCRAEYVRYPPPVCIHYDKANYLPSNFIAIGDSSAQLTPVTGQGTAKSAGHLIILATLLSKYQRRNTLPSTFSHDFFQESKNRLGYLWRSTKELDYNFKTTVPVAGETLNTRSFSGRLSSMLMRLSTVDREMSSFSLLVRSALMPPQAIVTYLPWIFWRIALLKLKNMFGRF